MSVGVYNETYFANRPEEKLRDGVLYGVVLVNKTTFERECIKVGIYHGSLYEVFCIEQMLHRKFAHDRFQPEHKFGGHTECFNINSKILDEFKIIKQATDPRHNQW